MTSQELRDGLGYDLVGVPPMSSFDGLPPEEHPRSLFPEAKSVVVVGNRIRRGEFRSMEEGSLWRTPGRWLKDMDGLVRLIESHGYECVPYLPTAAAKLPHHIETIGYTSAPEVPMDETKMPKRPVRQGQVRPNGVRLSVEYAAVAAGLGRIGYHGMFMSDEYGIRQQLGLLVTDMEIEPDGVTSGASPCDMCMECVKMCPLQAISEDTYSELTVDGTRMKIGMINPEACKACPNGVAGDSSYFAGAEELHFEVKNNQVVGDAKSVFARGGLPNRLAAPCGRACIAHYEKIRKTGYAIPFRVREPWGFRPDDKKGW